MTDGKAKFKRIYHPYFSEQYSDGEVDPDGLIVDDNDFDYLYKEAKGVEGCNFKDWRVIPSSMFCHKLFLYA